MGKKITKGGNKMKLKDQITQKVLRICKENNISLSALSEKTSYTEKYLKRLLDITNSKRRFTINDVEVLSIALKVKPQELVNYERSEGFGEYNY